MDFGRNAMEADPARERIGCGLACVVHVIVGEDVQPARLRMRLEGF